ncbi:DNA polymerase IV [Nemorincola caseinilytica]|uniref:DNA polymerase IV n=1 Tax=Nemorincola caseinilytica TaxID=2054315 RepID=A0ABP8N9V4_9BACT
MKGAKDYFSNSTGTKKEPLVMYVDMNCYFASCEQQRNPQWRGKPLGVVTYNSYDPAVIAASIEAKQYGIRSGMRYRECLALCPQLITTPTNPAWYRQVHVDIMAILRRYCDDVIPKSIDEAVCNFHSYALVYKDIRPIAMQVKADIAARYDWLRCSIGIAPNSFLAKVGTELQKPDGLQLITEDNIDEQLGKMKLQGLPGIAARNERRLNMIGIRTPVEMRHASPALLRKAFGGVVGEYWYKRLNFGEVDMYSRAENRTMSATRTMSSEQSRDRQQLESMIISLCTRLEQRMVTSDIFCREVCFSIRYRDDTRWDTAIKLAEPVQDAMEMRSYILQRMAEFERSRGIGTLLTDKVTNLTVAIQGFISGQVMQYSLFDNRLRKDTLRKVIYKIKDEYDQKNIVRKGAELLNPFVLKDAVGFGSVRDLGDIKGNIKNKHMLEEDKQKDDPYVRKIKQKPPPPPPREEDPYCDVPPPDLVTGEEQYLSLAAMHKAITGKQRTDQDKDLQRWKNKALGI